MTVVLLLVALLAALAVLRESAFTARIAAVLLLLGGIAYIGGLLWWHALGALTP